MELQDAQNAKSQQLGQAEKQKQSAVEEQVLKKFPQNDTKKIALHVLIALVVVLAGVATGWLFSGRSFRGIGGKSSGAVPEVKTSPMEAGVADEATFRDSAEGILREGGVDGEGTHHLERGFGPEKDVYLISTVIDLQTFVGKRVKVWGETISAQKAGWLMDVGRIKVIE